MTTGGYHTKMTSNDNNNSSNKIHKNLSDFDEVCWHIFKLKKVVHKLSFKLIFFVSVYQ